jgi:hypothetical protein
MSDFDRIILNFAEQTAEQIKELRINVHKELVASVIGDTPLDTGMARRNWQAAKDSIPTGIVPYAGDPSAAGAQAVSEAQAQAFGEDGTFYFVNNVHYVPYLENGTSKMAAVGMARKNVERIKNNLRQQYG